MDVLHPATRQLRSKHLLVNISAVPNFVQHMQPWRRPGIGCRLGQDSTHLNQAYRLSTLFGLLTLAYLWALLVGEFKRCLELLRQKVHGRMEQSIFRYGLDEFAQTLKHARADWDWYVHLLLAPYRSTRLQL